MRGELAHVERLTLKRQEPLVPCCIATDKVARWKRQLSSCGAMIPYKPSKPCPECGAPQARPQAPEPGPDARLITRDTAIIDEETGEVVVVYATGYGKMASALLHTLRDVTWDRDVYWSASTTTRLSGLAVTHRTFGYQPPQPIRKRYACSRSQFNSKYPEAMEVLTQFCTVAEGVLRNFATDVADSTAKVVADRIAPAWRINGTPWTSGIINYTAALPYHRDQGNVRGSWSAMLGARHHVTGGYLHLVDYDTYLNIGHGSISIFDGQSVVHGVTPFEATGLNPMRVTVVTYSKLECSKCHPDPSQEAKRAQMVVTEAEDRRLTGFRPTRRKKA